MTLSVDGLSRDGPDPGSILPLAESRCQSAVAIAPAARTFRNSVASATPNPTRLLTQWGLLSRERESSGEMAGQERDRRYSRPASRELSPSGDSSQVVTAQAENAKRRGLSLSAFSVNPAVGGNSAI